MADAVPHNQSVTIITAERVASILSVVGCFFIITTFAFDSRFRKPINRLVFYASWGNLLTNTATLISRSGIMQGINSPLCQFQAFIIQWLMPADALWTFAMACNVWLTFFKQYDASSLKHLEWRYALLCYGLPFVPAFVYLFISTPSRGKLYGSANLWCWVSDEWNYLRIATFYGPIWVLIIINMFIYIRVGGIVFRWREQLISQDQKSVTQRTQRSYMQMDEPMSPPVHKGYEVNIHSQVPHEPERVHRISFGRMQNVISPPHQRDRAVESRHFPLPFQHNTVVHHPKSKAHMEANRATISYCYTACLFFMAMLITWVPSTINRIWTLATPAVASPFALDLVASIVLSLQGFWNTFIYILTSYTTCKALFGDMIETLTPSPRHRDEITIVPDSFRRDTGCKSISNNAAGADIHMHLEGKNRIIQHNPHPSHSSRDHPYSPQPMSIATTYVGSIMDRTSNTKDFSAGSGYAGSEKYGTPGHSYTLSNSTYTTDHTNDYKDAYENIGCAV